jgi:5-methylcytosine-specific restriction endonuclease McrA
LARLAPDSYRLFTGLWCLADREGRLEDRPSRIEAEIFPFKFQTVDIEKMLQELSDGNEPFIIRYEKERKKYIQIVSFTKHQQPHYKEPPSTILPPVGHNDSEYVGGGVSDQIRLELISKSGQCKICGKKKDLTIDHIKPRVFGGTNERENLQVLCRKCNSAKNNRIYTTFQKSANVDPTLGTQYLLNPPSPILNPESNREGEQPPSPTPENLLELYNRTAKEAGLPIPNCLTSKRRDKARLRLKEHPQKEFWIDVMGKIKASKFLVGDNNRGWRMDFDFLIANEDNCNRIQEGKYDNVGKGR